MAQWGRSSLVGISAVAASVPRYGRRSLLCALAAFGSVLIAFWVATSLTGNAEEPMSDVAFGAFLLIFLVVAPIVHIVGLVFGVMGLSRSGGRVSSIFGIILNVGLVGTGILLAWIVLKAGAAFT